MRSLILLLMLLAPSLAWAGDARMLFMAANQCASGVYHTITSSAGTGGSISPSGAVAVCDGSNKLFALTPSANYEITDILVDSASVGGGSSYTFIDVQEDHTIESVFAPVNMSTFESGFDSWAGENEVTRQTYAAHSGNYGLDIYSLTWASTTTAYKTITCRDGYLSFWYKWDPANSGGTFKVSVNGGASWTDLSTSADWAFIAVPVVSGSNNIRFETHWVSGDVVSIQLDDIKIPIP